MTTGPQGGGSAPAAALRAGLILAAAALAANVFRFSPAEPLSRLQGMLVGLGAALAAGGVAWGLLGPGRPLAGGAREAGRIAGIAAQVALLAAVIHRFQIESPVFFERLIPLAGFGFLVNHLLPARWRLPFFTLLSLAGIHLVFGPKHGFWLFAFGAGLIALCELPVPWAARVAVLLAAGGALALMRSEVIAGPWPASIWPILGSMFMFRLIVYMYDLKHRREPFRFWRAVSYFFMLPNLVFPLFPVVDYTTYGRTYYDGPPARIYQRGLRWMLLGTLHLIAYRIVYQYFTISPADVSGVPGLGRYVVSNFLLYFRVSGQFHLIVGMLHLFGFHLPETHHRFFYSSGFMDFWRRINIYWKDFMMKVVYFPAYFRLRKAGEATALVVATLVVFLVTWLTHSYQWFWILGEWLLSLTDMLFWAILAVLVVWSTFREMKRGRKRSLGGARRTLRETVVHSFRVATFFAFISLLWSLWTAPTLGEWIGMIGAARIGVDGLLLIAGALAAGTLVLTVGFRTTEWMARTGAGKADRFNAPAMILLLLASFGAESPGVAVPVRELARDVRVPGLNRQDQELMQRGYYEKLTKVNRFNSQLWEVYAGQGRAAPPEIRRPTGDFQGLENIPLLGVTYKGQPLRTNRWGMRDKDYEMEPPPDTFRIALLGASYVMGSGVGDGETFEWVLEDKLNAAAEAAGTGRVEILNFAVGTLSSAQQLFLLRRQVLPFRPDAVMLVCPATDADLFARHLFRTREEGVEIPYPFLRHLVDSLGVDSTLTEDDAMRALEPVRGRIVRWVYREFADECRANGILPLWVYLTLPGRTPDPALIEEQIEAATAAGFVVLDLRDVYEGYEPRSLQVAPWDWHPNPLGHRIIAERLHRELKARPGVLPGGGAG